jgi:hypothetical protein
MTLKKGSQTKIAAMPGPATSSKEMMSQLTRKIL